MSRRARLDSELVRRGLARSREQATELIAAGVVRVDGQSATKAASQVATGSAIVVDAAESGPTYVSRGGHKLAGALAAFSELDPSGRYCLDAGASTGGFTDVLLKAGAAHVIAVDVGYGQLAWSLRTDERVTPLDRRNVRELRPEDVRREGRLPDLVVADLSFISLRLVLPPLYACAEAGADFVVMVKPQFEVGKDVVRDPALRGEAVRAVADHAYGLGLGTLGVVASPLPGPSGNVEFFLWLRTAAPALTADALERAVEAGPQGAAL